MAASNEGMSMNVLLALSHRGRRPTGGLPLQLEELEPRCLLSGYTVTDFGTFGGTISIASDVSARGEVAGSAETPCDCLNYPFLWSGGVLHDLGAPGYAFGLNDHAEVVGQLIPGGHAFLWSRQSGLTDLGYY